MIELLATAAAVAASIAAIFAVLGFFRRGADPGEIVREEAARTRSEAAGQARELREELNNRLDRAAENQRIFLDGAIGGVRQTLEGRLDTFNQRADEAARALRQELTGNFKLTAEQLAAALKDAGAQQSEKLQELAQQLAMLIERQSQSADALRVSVEHKLDAADRRNADGSRALREELMANSAASSAQLTSALKDIGTQQTAKLAELVQQLAALSEKQAHAAEALRVAVEGRLEVLRSANEQKLEQMRQTVEEKLQSTLEQRLGESFRTVSEQLKQVHQGLGEMQTLASGVGDLKKVLTNVKTRGTWGEVQIGLLLEQFLSPEQYLRNAQCRPGSAERVEYAIRFGARDGEGDLLLPIDAKFPHEDYERLLQAAEHGDAAGVEAAGAALEQRVRSFAKTVAEKYVNPPYTTDFAVLFLPTESLFAEILRRPGFFETLQRDFRVTLAGPTTLASMLNAFQMGFRSLAIQQRSSEVWKLLGAVRQEFAKHGKVVDTLKKQLGAATNTIDQLGTRTRAMNRQLREVEVLPGSADLLGLAAPDAAYEDEAAE